MVILFHSSHHQEKSGKIMGICFLPQTEMEYIGSIVSMYLPASVSILAAYFQPTLKLYCQQVAL